MRTARATSRAARSYAAADGLRVEIEASHSYDRRPRRRPGAGGLPRPRACTGPSWPGCACTSVPPAEIRRICGGDPRVVACYSIGEGRMFVPGESGVACAHPGRVPAHPRVRPPHRQLAPEQPLGRARLGREDWSSAVHICTGVNRGLLFPGNQGATTGTIPGEGFADSYAHLHYPHEPWNSNQMMRPARPFAAIRRDVLEPWSAPRRRTFRGRLGPHERSAASRSARPRRRPQRGWRRRGSVYEVRPRRPASPPAGACATAAGSATSGAASQGRKVELTVRRREGARAVQPAGQLGGLNPDARAVGAAAVDGDGEVGLDYLRVGR